MAELVNDGSREIRDVTLKIEFADQEKTVLDSLTVSFDSVPSHTSLSGDKMELDLRGYSVWEEYTILIQIDRTDFRGSENQEQFIHVVSEQVTAKFHNDCKEVTWFF